MSQEAVNPTSLTLEQTAQLLAAAGGRNVTADAIREDIAAGAPTNPDGTMNLLNYVAWLAREGG